MLELAQLHSRGVMKAPRSNKTGFGCLVLFALPFAGVGAFMAFQVAKQLWWWQEARTWVAVPAVIENVQLHSHDSDDSTTYSLTARYRYDFEGRTYTGSRVALLDGKDNIGDFHQKTHRRLAQRWRAETPATCFVDPKDPTRAVLVRNVRWKLALFHLTFVGLFGGVGFGLLCGLPIARRRMAEREHRELLYANEPWNWEPKWQDGFVKASAREALGSPLLFAVFWNMISWPVVLLGANEIFDPDNRLALVALLFPAVGIGLAVWALRAWVRSRKFGDSELHLEPFPVPVGGRLAGRVHATLRIEPGAKTLATLSCMERSGRKNSDTRLLWQDQMEISSANVSFDGIRSLIPVSFALPADARETVEHDLTWKLAVQAEAPGVDYAADFEVPVFGQAMPERLMSPNDEAHDSVASSVAEADLAGNGISVAMEPAGGRRYIFGRARHKLVAVFLTAFWVVWSGISVLLWNSEAPKLFGYAFAFFSFLILLGVLDLWLTKRALTAGPEGLKLRTGFLALGRTVHLEPHSIKEIKPHSGMRSGNKLFYRVLATTDSGKKYTLADKLESLSLAKRLVESVRRDLES